MTPTLMARLFIVPAIIVSVLLAVAVVIVLFGTTTVDKPVSIATLLDRIERDDGARTMDVMLLPQAKESWQAAQELARRLSDRDKFISAEEIEPAARRIVEIIEKHRPQQEGDVYGEQMQLFLMLALARLQTPTAVEPLAALLTNPRVSTRQTALQALAEMRDVPQTHQVLDRVVPLLNDPDSAVQIVACATVGAIAKASDVSAVEALRGKVEGDREVGWNAALALGRLGSSGGKMVLLNMLDRGYWEQIDLSYEDRGAAVRRKYTPDEISRNLTTAIEAAANLKDTDLWKQIAALESDRAAEVRQAARTARTGGPTSSSASWWRMPRSRSVVFAEAA